MHKRIFESSLSEAELMKTKPYGTVIRRARNTEYPNEWVAECDEHDRSGLDIWVASVNEAIAT